MSQARAKPDTWTTGREGSAPLLATSAAGVIHDLGNMIQIASAAVSIVARDPGLRGAKLKSALDGAKKSLEQAGALVRQTMTRERMATQERADVAACLGDVKLLVRSAGHGRIRLVVRTSPGLPAAKCDPLALRNAVLNLVFNARDAMPGGGVITISAYSARQDSAEWVELCVADRGVGMRPHTVDRAFEPFFTTKCDGTGGVGLSTVEHFVRDAGGHVRIDSEYGVGTTVTLRLPAHP